MSLFALMPAVPGPAEMDAWAAQAYGLYEIAAQKAGASNACLRELRASGVIR